MKNKKFSDYVRPCLPIMGLGLLIKFLGTVAELFMPSILSYMIDDIAPTGNVSLKITIPAAYTCK